MKRNNVYAIGSVLAIGALLLSGCSGSSASEDVADDCVAESSFTTTEDGVVTVALTNTPPYSLEEGNEISGIDGDLVKEFAEANCLGVEYAPYTYATAIPAIEQGRADISTGGFYRTADRADVVTLSTPLYLDELSVYTEEGLSTVDELSGLTIGTVEGYLWVDDLNNLEGVETRVYSDSLALAQDLDAGRIDAALDGYGAATVSTQDQDYEINVLENDDRVSSTNQPSQASVLIDPSNSELEAAFNEFVEEQRDNGRLIEILADYQLPESAAEVGDERVIE